MDQSGLEPIQGPFSVYTRLCGGAAKKTKSSTDPTSIPGSGVHQSATIAHLSLNV